jgi:hypothetical protein
MAVFRYEWSVQTEDTRDDGFYCYMSCTSECVLEISGDILFIPLHFQSLMKYLQDESLDKRKVPFSTNGWQTENVQVCYFKT